MLVKEISERDSIILDFVRGVSAQLVLVGHLLSFFGFQQEYHIPIIQNFGVVVFFILSGFLITQTSLLKGRDYGLKNYLIDRFSRIYSAYIPAVIFVIIIDSVLKFHFNTYDPSFKFNLKNFTANIFMLQGYPFAGRFNVESFGSARIFWTVSIEWWIYICFGILFYKKPQKRKITFTILLILSSFLVAVNIVGRGIGLTIYWVIGLVLALLYNLVNIKIQAKKFTWIIILAVLLLLYRAVGVRQAGMYDVGLAVLFTFILFLLMNAPDEINALIKNKQFSRFSRFIASYSYSLYLLHYTIIIFMMNFLFKEFDYIAVIIIYLVSNIISFVFYCFFERNYRIFKNWLKKVSNEANNSDHYLRKGWIKGYPR